MRIEESKGEQGLGAKCISRIEQIFAFEKQYFTVHQSFRKTNKKEIFYELHLIGFLVSNFLKILKIELSAYGVKDKEKNKNLSGLFAKLEKDSKRQIEKGKIW